MTMNKNPPSSKVAKFEDVKYQETFKTKTGECVWRKAGLNYAMCVSPGRDARAGDTLIFACNEEVIPQ